jgi:hypothetical protein
VCGGGVEPALMSRSEVVHENVGGKNIDTFI